ncbi:hypothetical protein FDP41_006020 [Naegleria fowleri]|uniref:RNA polymerase Rpb4/RPC9 core domain-containing protein n=1 Tax=Naegleria fowleri TaxID=5763 RepID=A0A6A5BMA1_NAEFO|nr:uncharacterized protein FDP41_006020 [Naegleria fowleri]KAF0975268.1 hypothetical protein FDP41_006020 [Naegleria fowleri]CAG4710790.1 unnamed protein product [Naegleria fowleri]
MEDTEDAERLELGDFKDKTCLTISEVAHILQRKKEELEKEQSDFINDIFDKSLSYAKRFGGGLSYESSLDIKTTLARQTLALKDSQDRKKLVSFQIAQLANLMPGDAEEAITLIPSLRVFDESEIEKILKDMETRKGY